MAVLTIDQHLCFALYSASRAMTAAYRPVLTEINLTYPQYLVLLVLWEASNDTADANDVADGNDTAQVGVAREDGVTVGRLGERLQLDSGTLSPLLKRLEANGFIRRERSRTDERIVLVTLTESGRALQARAQCIPERLFASTGMTEADAADLRDAVRRLTDALTASSEDSRPPSGTPPGPPRPALGKEHQ